VLPLRVLNDQQSLEPFAQGLTEDLITDLARAGSERLRVVAYSSMRQIGKQSDLATLRSQLGADYVVRGTIRDAGARQRITIRLEDTRDGSLTWARRFDGQMGDGLTAEADTIVAAIIRGLSIGGPDPPGTSRADGLPAAARESLLRARWFLNRQTRDDSERALAELDSIRTTFNKNARVWALTAEARTSLGRYETAEAAAREAMRLDAELSDGPYQLGQTLAATGRFDEALEAFEQAVELAPGVARHRQALAHQLWRQKRRQEAVEHMEVARELDPLSIDLEVDLGYLFIEINRLPEAVQHCERSLVLLPENRWGRLCLLKAHYLLGDLAAALAQAQAMLRLQGATPRALGTLDQADARIGMLTLFDQTLQGSDDRQGTSASPDLARTLRSLLAHTHSALQDRARQVAAVGTMDRPQDHGPEWPGYERWLTYIWGDPRFERLLRREDWVIPWGGAADSSN
jgi:TolB-like protein/Flp pilus assembly protein TadD